VESKTRAAFMVQTRGKKRPVASAKPAMMPEASAVGLSQTAKTVPEVPIEMMTSPGPAQRLVQLPRYLLPRTQELPGWSITCAGGWLKKSGSRGVCPKALC